MSLNLLNFDLKKHILDNKLLDNSQHFYNVDPYYDYKPVTDTENLKFMSIIDVDNEKFYKRKKLDDKNFSKYLFCDDFETINIRSLLNKKLLYIEYADKLSQCDNMVRNATIVYFNIDSNYSYDEIFSKCYRFIMLDKNYKKSTEGLQKSTEGIMHWIWYRKSNSKFPLICAQRVHTWIYNNPEFEFNLWTDITCYDEYLDFISLVPDGLVRSSLLKINLIYKDQFKTFLTEVSLGRFSHLLDTWSPDNMMVKTDIFRCIILYHHGGFYSDFNDTICFMPLKYIIRENYELILGSDTNKLDANNYFIYCDKKSPKMSQIIQVMLRSIDSVLKFHQQAHTLTRDVFIESNKKFIEFLRTTTKNTAVPLNELCHFLKEYTLHKIANVLDQVNIDRNLIELLVCHPEMFRKILQIHIWVMRKCGLFNGYEKLIKILEDSYCNTTNVTHSTVNCKWINGWTEEELTMNVSELENISEKTQANQPENSPEVFYRYFANNTQHVCMTRTNAGMIANALHLDFECIHNMYILRALSFFSGICHIGTGSAAGDVTCLEKKDLF